jgi:hypothetical protein
MHGFQLVRFCYKSTILLQETNRNSGERLLKVLTVMDKQQG